MNGNQNGLLQPLQLPGMPMAGTVPLEDIVKKINEQAAQESLAAASPKEKEATEVQEAGIQATGKLVGDLFAQNAMVQRAKQQAQLDSAKQAAEVQSKGLQAASQAQQDSFTNLMRSMRSALVGG